MFGVAWTELLVILAVALLVIGPKDLPRVLYSAGKILRNVRRFTGDIQKSLDDIMRDQELDEIVRDANRAGGDNLQFELDKQVQAEEARRLKARQSAPDLLPSAKPAAPAGEEAVEEHAIQKKPEENDATG